MNTISTVQPSAVSAPPYCAPPRRLKLSAGFEVLRKLSGLILSRGRRFSPPARKSYPIGSNIMGYSERRTPALLEAGRFVEQERLDKLLEREYRRRVALNWKERARVLNVPRAWLSPENAKPGMLSRQAN